MLGKPRPAAVLGKARPAVVLGKPGPAAVLGKPCPAAVLGKPRSPGAPLKVGVTGLTACFASGMGS